MGTDEPMTFQRDPKDICQVMEMMAGLELRRI
jgi:hypothetical protein